MRIHAIQTGRLVGNRTFLRGESWSSLLGRRADLEFPAYCFIIERPDGLIAIDTGLTNRVRVPRIQRRFVPTPAIATDEEVGPRMRAAGLDPAEVRTVVLTHLDWDHAGGVASFPNAEVLVHRRELDFADTLPGRMRYQPRLWPAGFEPTTYELEPEPHGPFPQSKPLTDDGELVLVPIAGHSIGQVGLVARGQDADVLFCADHCLRQDWFTEDLAADREVALGIFFREKAIETSRRIRCLARERRIVLAPSHDTETPHRLADPAGSVWAPVP